jgi:hypothetical protein
MTWNPPSDIPTGTPLTTTLWNNQLGANGSLNYILNDVNVTQVKRHAVLWKSTTTTYASAANTSFTFDTVMNFFSGGQQLNFPVTVPVTNIPIPAEGMYIAAFQFTTSVNVVFRINYVVFDGSTTYNYTSTTNSSNSRFVATCVFYVPNSSTTLTVFGQSSAATVVSNDNFIASNGASQLLTIVRI